MKKWITGDIHFSHTNILKFCAATRPFKDVSEMNDAIIRNWNSLVSPLDTTYILGDVAFGDVGCGAHLVRRLHGNKILIKGNHDVKMLRDQAFRDCFTEVHDYLEISHAGTRLVMFHYPLWEWSDAYRGAVHFHGHLHGRPHNIPGRIMDVAMDDNYCTPYLLDTAIKQTLKKPSRGEGG